MFQVEKVFYFFYRWGRTPYKDAEENMFEDMLAIFKDNGYTGDANLSTETD